ncbi:hypothetical protein KC725_00370 [Candidatus Peregrinibacteria bacterium]|nr:hypothetical protein [Candidatus Peregrinibacteria bacterium]
MKKTLLLITTLALAGCNLLQAPQSPAPNTQTETEIPEQEIQQETETTPEDIFSQINAEVANATITTKELEGFSTEGSIATFYEINDEIRKIKVTHFGETGKRVNEFFYEDSDEPFAAITTLHTYNAHIIDPEFDESKTTVESQTLHFPEDAETKTGDDLLLEADELLHILYEPPFPNEENEPDNLQSYAKDYFSLTYPSTFMVQTADRDYGKLISTDDTVIVELYSPLWSGEPTSLFERSNEDEIATKTTTSTDSNSSLGTGTTRTTTWKTFEAKDGLYTRSIEDNLFTGPDGSQTRYTWSVQYKNQEAYDLHKAEYLLIKDSLIQYAD